MQPETNAHSVRQATAQDAVPACHILRHSVEQGPSPAFGQYDPELCKSLGEQAAERVRQWIESPDYYSVVAQTATGDLVGFSLLARNGDLKLCYVLPQVAQQGVGARMLSDIERHGFGVWQLPQIQLQATAEAANFYQKLGYQVQTSTSSTGAQAGSADTLQLLAKSRP